jgi:competence protein ComFB
MRDIHNIMEDLATRVVDDVISSMKAKPSGDLCFSELCRQDAICFILNRVPPRYVSSARGIAHTSQELKEDQQLLVDLTTLAHEGLRRISTVRRYYYSPTTSQIRDTKGPVFPFPAIRGRVINGSNFSPVSDVAVSLYYNQALVPMMDPRWENPYVVSRDTYGTFCFWPIAEVSDHQGQERTFDFELSIEDERYEPLRHGFSLTVSPCPPDQIEHPADFMLQDLFLLPVA